MRRIIEDNMSNKVELETVRKKIQGLDNELDTFIEAVREIKEIRNTLGALPEDLKQNTAEIEARKKEIEKLVASGKDMLIAFEEQSRGVIFDLEKKTDTLATEVQLQISQIKDTARKSSNELLELHKEKIKELSNSLNNETKVIPQKIEKRIGKVEEKFNRALARQKVVIAIMSIALIAGIVFAVYSYFIQ